jgi:hypothetical protein
VPGPHAPAPRMHPLVIGLIAVTLLAAGLVALVRSNAGA